MENDASKILDLLEGALIEHTRVLTKMAGYEITEDQARNLIGKVGVRIAFGKKIADPIITKEK